ncbi:hypothetical protein LCGC14_1284920 [marine sediment metagenome]|uniref:Uncharacterized protein n=1 Tax=marine sediment metagenome TaxID=412755 RepID=A0A0F9LF66_9ZZZZ
MRVVFPAAAGAAPPVFVPYYDRTPLIVHESGATSTAFDATGTTRWTYTVPVNRRAHVGLLSCYLVFNNLATEMLRAENQIHNAVVPTTLTRILTAEVTQGTQGDKYRVAVNPDIWMAAGDLLMWRTYEQRFTGVSTHEGILNALEFDA